MFQYNTDFAAVKRFFEVFLQKMVLHEGIEP